MLLIDVRLYKAHYMKNNGEARGFGTQIKREVLEHQYYACAECGRSLWRKGMSQAQGHHIVMYSRGGSRDISNCVVLCPECHKRVDQMTIEGHIWPGNYTMEDADPKQKR